MFRVYCIQGFTVIFQPRDLADRYQLIKKDLKAVESKPSRTEQTKGKSASMYWTSHKNEYRWITKEQLALERWQKKMARKRGIACSDIVKVKSESDEVKQKREEVFMKKGARKIAEMVHEFWGKFNKCTAYYEMVGLL